MKKRWWIILIVALAVWLSWVAYLTIRGGKLPFGWDPFGLYNAVPMSDTAGFRQHCDSNSQQELEELSKLATDVNAFILSEFPCIFICGKLTQPPTQFPTVPGALQIGNYALSPYSEPSKGHWAQLFFSRALHNLPRDERMSWQERWNNRGKCYKLNDSQTTGRRPGYVWLAPKDNFFIAFFS